MPPVYRNRPRNKNIPKIAFSQPLVYTGSCDSKQKGFSMSHLIQLKRRIRSIKTTEKLTHAMRLISMSLYSKLDKELTAVIHHEKMYKDILLELAHRCPEWKNPIFFSEDILNANPLFIVISATKGFCGGLNNFLFRYLEEKLFVEEHQTPNFVTIGKKATDFVESKKFGSIVATYHDLKSTNYPDIAQSLTKHIMEQTPRYSSVTIYSSFFKNFFVQRPQITQLLPLQKELEKEPVPEQQTEPAAAYVQEESELLEIEPIWEQDKVEIINFAAKRYLDVHATTILFQALISEYAARFVAMDNATTNAEKYLESLTLQFNKMRQALITREVSELSANL